MIVTIILAFLLAVSAVSAHNNVTNDVISVDKAKEVVSAKDTQAILGNESEVGTFHDLAIEINEIESDETLNLTKDYEYNTSYYSPENALQIDKSITIDGKGHSLINGGINISSEKVVVKNTIFKNLIYTNTEEFIAYNCTFIECENDDPLDNHVNMTAFDCKFIGCNYAYDSFLKGLAYNCTFINCTSPVPSTKIFKGTAYDSKFINCSCWGGETNGLDNLFNCTVENFKDTRKETTMRLNVNEVYQGESAVIKIYVSADDGEIKITVNNQSGYATYNPDYAHSASYEIENLKSGNYTIYAEFMGDENNQPVNSTYSFEVKKQTFEDIQKLIDENPENCTVYLAGNYFSTGSSIKVNKNIKIAKYPNEPFSTVTYADPILDAESLSRIFEVRNGTLKLEGITLINAKTTYNEEDYGSDRGGAIYAEVDGLECKDCKFINNFAEYGGAIYCVGSNTIDNCYFEKNNDGGYCIMAGDYRDTIRETLKIKNSTFNNNLGKSIVIMSSIYYSKSYDYQLFGNLEIDGCLFSNNNHVLDACNNVKLTNTKFINNTRIINVEYGDFEMSNCKLTGNTYETEIMDLHGFGSAKINNCTFKNNKNGLLCAWSVSKLVIDGKNYDSYASLDDKLNTIYYLSASYPSKLSTSYNSGKTLDIKLINKYTKEAQQDYLTIKVYTGKQYKTYHKWTNSKGIGKFKVSSLSAGIHKIEITVDGTYKLKKVTSTVTIAKAKTTVKAPKITAKYKKSKYFQVTIKTNNKALKNTYVKIKIDKKTYKVKTNSKGIAKVNTKNLKVGTHKVVVSSGNANYKMSAKSTITIKK